MGWIALDIDGTIANYGKSTPAAVVSYLKTCTEQGWRIAIVTGRSFRSALLALEAFDFPYLLVIQNGACAFEMPMHRSLFSQGIPVAHLQKASAAFEGISGDFFAYAEAKNDYWCYWRPDRYCGEQLSYLQKFWNRQTETWCAVGDFCEIPCAEVQLLKSFGSEPDMRLAARRLIETGLFEVSVVHDSFKRDECLLLATDFSVSKGSSLKRAIGEFGLPGRLIAAGDDYNDLSLLKAADVKIAMANAPKELLELAHVIAPPASEQGIIAGLQSAIGYRYA